MDKLQNRDQFVDDEEDVFPSDSGKVLRVGRLHETPEISVGTVLEQNVVSVLDFDKVSQTDNAPRGLVLPESGKLPEFFEHFVLSMRIYSRDMPLNIFFLEFLGSPELLNVSATLKAD